MGKQKSKSGGKGWKPKCEGSKSSKDRGRADEVKDLKFGVGKATDAADFKKAKITLCRFIGSKTFEGSDKASYALEYGIAPVSVKPEAPQIPSRRKVIVNSELN